MFSIFLARCSLEHYYLVNYLRIHIKINISDDQEKDIRKMIFYCFEIYFEYCISIWNSKKNKTRRKKLIIFILEWLHFFVSLISLWCRWKSEYNIKYWILIIFLLLLLRHFYFQISTSPNLIYSYHSLPENLFKTRKIISRPLHNSNYALFDILCIICIIKSH